MLRSFCQEKVIKPHVDQHPLHAGHRIHVPITTNPRVRFMIDGRPFQLEVGQAYEINNQRTHSVMNKARMAGLPLFSTMFRLHSVRSKVLE